MLVSKVCQKFDTSLVMSNCNKCCRFDEICEMNFWQFVKTFDKIFTTFFAPIRTWNWYYYAQIPAMESKLKQRIRTLYIWEERRNNYNIRFMMLYLRFLNS